MPDVTELLSQDHRKVEGLFSQFESSKSRDVAIEICDELTIHAMLEEEIVYPVLAQVDEDLEEHAEEEHDEAKSLIAQIRTAGEGELEGLVMKLKKSIEHHVEEEEGKAWPKLRDQAADQLEDLGGKVEARKGEMMQDKAAAIRQGTAESMTKTELYDKAKEAGVEGRSGMSKEELAEAVTEETR